MDWVVSILIALMVVAVLGCVIAGWAWLIDEFGELGILLPVAAVMVVLIVCFAHYTIYDQPKVTPPAVVTPVVRP